MIFLAYDLTIYLPDSQLFLFFIGIMAALLVLRLIIILYNLIPFV